MSYEKSQFSVLDMAKEMTDSSDINIGELFHNNKKPDTSVVPESNPVVNEPQTQEWQPDESLLDGMDEFNPGGVVYDKSDITESNDGSKKNGAEEEWANQALETMDELSRKEYNIEVAKKRHGISKFRIPDGNPFQVMIMNAAIDTNYDRAQEVLDKVFNQIKTTYPELILEWSDPAKANNASANVTAAKIVEYPDANKINNESIVNGQAINPVASSDVTDEDDVKIVIDKSGLPEISWTPEDMDKIRKSRTLELNIVEGTDIEMAQIEEADNNAIDTILSTYQRKANDITAALPASKYRATFTGLTYPEVLDLSNSTEMNNIDGERKKWTICFNHIKNPSIGEWRSYIWYIDPVSKKRVEVPELSMVPGDVEKYYTVSKFEDFLRKTSYLDLEFMLWKILCATAMEKEIISITCHNNISENLECGHSYDWIYNPADLLLVDSVNPAVLEEMKITAEAAGTDEIIKNYNTSMLRLNNTVKLKTSGLIVIFGHASGYDYLEHIYPAIAALDDEEDESSIVSRGMTYTMLSAVKGFLVPCENGKYKKITGMENIIKIITGLDEFDWQILMKIVEVSIRPYAFRYAIRGLVCPKCKYRSSVIIESISRLLFIVAQSLSSVQVTLKKV